MTTRRHRTAIRTSLTLVALCALLAVRLAPSAALAQTATVGCRLALLSFQALREQVPDLVGDCAGEADTQANGDVQQPTTRGLLVWSSAQNWAAFTNGVVTVIDGPCGLQQRPSGERFAWEDGSPCPVAAPSAEHPYPQVEQYLLDLVNQARRAAGRSPVAWDALAADASLAHAQEMAAASYLSHWDLAGRLPHERYALLGGRDYVAENVGCWGGAQGEEQVAVLAERMQRMMIDEAPPNDGHRQNILDPDRTAVGIGVAYANSTMCLTNEFTNHYLTLEGLPTSAVVGQAFQLVPGRAVSGYTVSSVGLGYLPLATPMSVAELQATSGYTTVAPTYRWLTVTTDPDGSFHASSRFDNPAGAGRYQVLALVTDASGRAILAANPTIDVR